MFAVSMVLAAQTMSHAGVRAARACESLARVAFTNTTITSARIVTTGGFTPPNASGGSAATAARVATTMYASLPAFCRVEATIAPVAGSTIGVEVWLPESGWNGKLQAVGNRGWGGTIGYPALAAAVASGYAAASTDTGHRGSGGRFALGHPEAVIDAGSRAVHETTVLAKAVARAFYRRAPRRSYWNGCSLGGRQGLAEAQRFPEDYDGIIAGDPANDLTHLYAARVAVAQAVHQSPALDAGLSAAALSRLHTAVLDACDALDGVKDGVLEDPTRCHVDPAALTCKAGETPAACLTAADVAAVRALYAPVTHPRTGARLSYGREPGSELGWQVVAGPQPETNAFDLFRYIVLAAPDWDWRTFDLARDTDAADARYGAILNAVDADLRPFFARGGKLLLYHGWADPQTPPRNSIDYYQRVTRTVGTPIAERSMRLFMVPGMGHCEGGHVPDQFDKVAALDAWVEHGRAPARIVASRVGPDGAVDRTRPLCPYGTVAQWNGAGSTDAEASFSCVIAPPER